MKVVEHKAGDILVAGFEGRLDAGNVNEMARKFHGWIENGERKLVLDLSRLEYISSVGLGMFLLVGKKMKARNGRVTFCGLTGLVGEIFDITGFCRLFPCFPSQEQAIQSLK